jgi:hypothetical protein
MAGELPPRRWDIADAPEHLPPVCDLLRRTIVKVDGVAVGRVRAWDCDLGKVVKIKVDDEGRPILNWEKGLVVEEVLLGDVTVELRENDDGR